MQFRHIPIMLEQCMAYLDIKADGTYVDCTAGGGGHSNAILDALTGSGRLICIDKDTEALSACKARFASHPHVDKVTLVHSDYKDISSVLNSLDIDKVDGILIDLGVSSYQLDNRDRGFSYMERSAPLDMRMDATQSLDASVVLNTYSQQRIYEIIRDYGEDRFARVIANNIVQDRQLQPIVQCGQLLDIIDRSIPTKFKITGGHPAKRTFQALRIEVNGELDQLDRCIRSMVDCLECGGRMVVLTFHSLEDRIVKHVFADCQTDCICPPQIPICVCNHRAVGKVLTKKPVVATEQELAVNSRSASCKLRAIQRI